MPLAKKDATPSSELWSSLLLRKLFAPKKGQEWLFLILAVFCISGVFLFADLTPKVERDFFFSTEDPQIESSEKVSRLFPSNPQIIIQTAAPNILSKEYLSKMSDLTQELSRLPGIVSARSLTNGPLKPSQAFESPLWGRLLLSKDKTASNLIILVDENAKNETLIPLLEEVVARFKAPDFDIQISGVPYVVELIRRNLIRDLKIFSTAALLLFGILVAFVFRAWRIVLGTLVSCITACALTLGLLHVLGKPIGLLTANLATIVFVLTLSHIVFLTSNWRQESLPEQNDAYVAVNKAISATFTASFWCMVTTLFGFLSLLFVSANPLRELGIAGSIGTVISVLVAYGIYPAFLRATKNKPKRSMAVNGTVHTLLKGRFRAGVIFLGVVCLFSAFGLREISTDPSLLSYFQPGSELRNGLEAIDRSGGSSPLNIVISDPNGEKLDTDQAYVNLSRLQKAMEDDSAVGIVFSLQVLLAETEGSPLSMLLTKRQLLKIMESPVYHSITLSFANKERTKGRFFLRMKESNRKESRLQVIERLKEMVRTSGYQVDLIGGLYYLQGQLGQLIASSLLAGLGSLFIAFLVIGILVSRSIRVTTAMVACLLGIPVFILGTMGHLRMPLDIIASPAANVAIAMGIDSMVHLIIRARRYQLKGYSPWQAWVQARSELWQPILGAMFIISVGFGIFSLSSFPPTQRFGTAVVLGISVAALVSLMALPFAAVANLNTNQKKE